jgi:hypothetical protein
MVNELWYSITYTQLKTKIPSKNSLERFWEDFVVK